jgi:TonB-linked SusC/RagA family outer membrane protein
MLFQAFCSQVPPIPAKERPGKAGARCFTKTLRVMKLTALVLIAFTIQASAKTYSQTITFSGKNIPLDKIFNVIEKQTGFVVFYDYRQIRGARPVTLDVKDLPLETFLERCFKDQPFGSAMEDKTIMITKKPAAQNASGTYPITPAAPVPAEKITGSIKGADGTVLEGASINIKGTHAGSRSNAKGEFSIEAPDRNTILQFSFIGYESQQMAVKDLPDPVVIVLQPSNNNLNQVAVIGYGTQKKSDLTGAISSVKGKDLTTLPAQRVDQALQGLAAGVSVLNTDGSPGGNTIVRVRGLNSINGGNDALIVIDGLQGGDLNSLNPNDVASVEILKDASATAIYGSQGANGVVLITTKSGKSGKPVIGYSYDLSRSTLRKKIDLLTAAQYAKNINTYTLANDGSGITPSAVFSDAQIANFQKTGGTDWQDVIYRPAITQNHQLSISGGTDKTTYLASFGYLDQQGILINSGYKRFSLRANLKTEITNWATFGVNWAGSKENSNSALFGGNSDWPNNPIGAALAFSPTVPVYDSAGNYTVTPIYGTPSLWNPKADAVEPIISNGRIRNNVNAYLEFKLLTGLTLRVSGGAIITNTNNLSFNNLNTYTGASSNGLGTSVANVENYYQNSNILTYDKRISKHHLTLTAVEEEKYDKLDNSAINASSFLIQQTGVYDLAGASIVKATSSTSTRVIHSYLGRINYIYDDRYLLTASYRTDGSSVFGANNKWGSFPSGSIAWRASQESFVKDLNIFSDLKIRASYGITGNQGIAPYQTLAHVTSGGNYPYNGTDATDLGFYISSAANPNLKWEQTAQTDLGLDAAILNGRVSFTADVYKKHTTNLLMPSQLPSYTGLTSIIANVGSMENKGLELAISGDPLTGTVTWNSRFNISFNRTRVLNLGNTDSIPIAGSAGHGAGADGSMTYLIKGQPFGQMIGWGYSGIWKTSEAAQAAAYGELPGDIKWEDRNHDGRIDMLDQKVMGNFLPKYVFGWNNQFTYKNFDLSFLIQGSVGNDVLNVAKMFLETQNGTSASLLRAWTPQNQNTDIPGIIPQSVRQNAALTSTINITSQSTNMNTHFVENASYVRLKNITLGYNFPRSLTNRLKLASLRLHVSVTNLVTLTKYTGYDPEVASYTGADTQLGSDYDNYPPSKTFNVGISTSF